jgi:hypothetical protein
MDLTKFGVKKIIKSPPLACFYGSPGIGKTAFSIGATAPDYKVGKDNHLLMNIDFRGSDRLVCRRTFEDAPCTHTRMIDNVFESLAEQDHPFTWFIIDDLSTLEELLVSEVCKENNVDELKKIEYGRGYELARTKWIHVFEMIRQLQEMKNIGVILIAHTKIDTMKDPMSDSYSRHDLQLDKRSKEIIKKNVDLIGFARKKILTKQVNADFKKENIPVGESKRVLTFSPDLEGFDSKDRFGLPPEIPLDWDIFETELKKTYDKNDPIITKSKKGEK